MIRLLVVLSLLVAMPLAVVLAVVLLVQHDAERAVRARYLAAGEVTVSIGQVEFDGEAWLRIGCSALVRHTLPLGATAGAVPAAGARHELVWTLSPWRGVSDRH